MKELLNYIEQNGNFLQYQKFYDEEECIYYWEATANVVFKSKYYYTSKISYNQVNNSPKVELVKDLFNQIIFEMGLSYTKKYFDNKESIKILHRGNKKDFMENSLEALTSAIEDYDGFETDIRLTKDDHWVVYHDDDCNRLHKLNVKIREYSLDFLQKNTNIITLKDLLFTNSFTDKFINIEIKQDFKISIAAKLSLINLLGQFTNKLLVSSFNWEWYKLISSYHFNFAHLVLNINKLPINYEKLILSYEEYKNILLKNFNIEVYGLYSLENSINSVSLSIIDLI